MAFNIDADLIYKAQAAGQSPSPLDQYKTLVDMQNTVAQHKAQQELGQNGFDSDQTMSYLARFDPKAAMELNTKSRIAAAQEAKYGAAANLDEQRAKLEQMKQASSQIDTISKVASGINDQASYTSGLAYLRNQGIDVSDMPATYDANLVKSKAEMALSAKDKLNMQIQQYKADVQAGYYEGLLSQGSQRIENDYALGQQRMDTTADVALAKLNEAERHNKAMEARGTSAAGKSNKRVIERNGQIYIVDPETNVVSEGKAADGSDYRSPSQRAQAEKARAMLGKLERAKALLQKGAATSGGLQTTLSGIAQSVNVTTEGMKDAAELQTLSGWFTSYVPRFEGPQSNIDVDNYRVMAGDLGNSNKTIEQRKAAFKGLVDLLRRDANMKGVKR